MKQDTEQKKARFGEKQSELKNFFITILIWLSAGVFYENLIIKKTYDYRQHVPWLLLGILMFLSQITLQKLIKPKSK